MDEALRSSRYRKDNEKWLETLYVEPVGAKIEEFSCEPIRRVRPWAQKIQIVPAHLKIKPDEAQAVDRVVAELMALVSEQPPGDPPHDAAQN